ncbi:hypothetical protein [Variovorax sp. 54]|uniref:hypothetical protein n=1 Tax=Variovorax sp. 54 TaxID=2035212 RepID=UPI000C196DA4|nr:hypothetical protein [Variovorax sp. 54]
MNSALCLRRDFGFTSITVQLEVNWTASFSQRLYSRWGGWPLTEGLPEVKAYRQFLAKYLPSVDITDDIYTAGYNTGAATAEVIRLAGNDLTRENIHKIASNLKAVRLPLMLPGISLNPTPTDLRPLKQAQFFRFNGTEYEALGPILPREQRALDAAESPQRTGYLKHLTDGSFQLGIAPPRLGAIYQRQLMGLARDRRDVADRIYLGNKEFSIRGFLRTT